MLWQLPNSDIVLDQYQALIYSKRMAILSTTSDKIRGDNKREEV
jgi:hypothetical protein